MPIDRKNSIMSFSNSFSDFRNKLSSVLEGNWNISGSPNRNFFPALKALGIIRRPEELTPIGELMKKRWLKERSLEDILPLLRIQILFYIQERDYKMPFLDILRFIYESAGRKLSLEELISKLESVSYFLGKEGRKEMTLRSYVLTYLEGVNYVKKRDVFYFIPEKVIPFLNKVLHSSLYRRYMCSSINDSFYNKYLDYYRSNEIREKMLFFRFGIE